MAGQPGFQALVKPSRKYAFIAWNGRRPPLDRPRVRRALAMAIDRREIIDALRGGFGELAAGPVPPHHWAYDEAVRPLPHDTAAARRLLAEAGLIDRNGDGRLETPQGEPFRIELMVPAASTFNRDVAEMIRADLASLGVDMRVSALEWNTLTEAVMSPERDFDAALLAWETDFKVALRDLFHSETMSGPFQSASYSNPEVDSLIDRVDTTVDREAARPLFRRLQEILRDEQPWGFLFYYPDLLIATDRLHVEGLDMRGAFATLPEWWLEPERAAPERTDGQPAAGSASGAARQAPRTAPPSTAAGEQP